MPADEIEVEEEDEEVFTDPQLAAMARLIGRLSKDVAKVSSRVERVERQTEDFFDASTPKPETSTSGTARGPGQGARRG